MPTDLPDDLVPIAEAAELLGMSVEKLKALSSQGLVQLAYDADGEPLASPSQYRAQFQPLNENEHAARAERDQAKQLERDISALPKRGDGNDDGWRER